MVTKIDSIEAVQRRTARWIKFNYFLTSPCDKHVKVFYSAQTWLQTYRQLAYLHVQNSLWPGCYPRSGLPYRAFRKFWYSRPLCYWLIKATTDYYKFFYFSMKNLQLQQPSPDILSVPTLEQFSAAIACIEHASASSVCWPYFYILNQTLIRVFFFFLFPNIDYFYCFYLKLSDILILYSLTQMSTLGFDMTGR